MAIHRDQQASAEVARDVHPTRADGVIPTIVSHVKSAHASQNVPQRAVTLLLDIIGGNDADGGRGFRDFLLVFRCPNNGVNLDCGEVFQAQSLERGKIVRVVVRPRRKGE